MVLDCERIDVKGSDTTEAGLNETEVEAAATGEQTGKRQVMVSSHLDVSANTSSRANGGYFPGYDIARPKCCQMKGLDIIDQ